MVNKSICFCLMLIIHSGLFSQQIADTIYDPFINKPAYDLGKGSVVFIDE